MSCRANGWSQIFTTLCARNCSLAWALQKLKTISPDDWHWTHETLLWSIWAACKASKTSGAGRACTGIKENCQRATRKLIIVGWDIPINIRRILSSASNSSIGYRRLLNQKKSQEQQQKLRPKAGNTTINHLPEKKHIHSRRVHFAKRSRARWEYRDHSSTLDLSQKAEKRYPNISSPRRVVQGFPLGDMVVNMLSPGGLEPTVGPRYWAPCL